MKIKKSIISFISVLVIIMSQIVIIPTVVAQETNYATSSQVEATAQLDNYDISRVIDGNTSQSAGGSKTAITSFDSMGYGYFELFLSEESTLNVVKLYFNQVEAKQRPRDIAIDVKRKDGVYVRVAEMHNIDYAIKSNGYGGINELDFIFEEIECVSVRVTGNRQRTRDINNSQTSKYNFRLMEIELFNKSNINEEDYTGTTADPQEKYNIPVPAPVFENLFANMEVSSSLQLSNYSVSRLTNGYKSISSDCSITSFNTANISYSEIILNGETELNQVRLYFSQYEPKQRPKDIAIDVRLKNGVYVRVAEMHNIDYKITSNTASVNTLDFKFENVKAVAVRISGNRQRTRDVNNEPTASYNFRLVEVEGYLNTTLLKEDFTGTQKEKEEKYNIAIPEPLLENLALNQTIIANKELTVKNVTYFASNLNDENKNYNADTETNAITQWNSVKTAYFEVQFAQTTKINRVGVFLTKWQKEYLPKDLAVDVQLANGVYIRVAEMHDINYASKENLVFSFNEVDAVAVRLTGSCARNSSSENFRLMELEVYYYPDMPEELFTGTTKDENDLYNIPVPDPVLINVALDKDVTANEILTAGKVTYEANNLTDGNSDYSAETEFNAITKWNNTTKTGYFEVDLGEKILINRTKIFLTKWQKEYLPLDIAVDVRLESGVYIRVAEMHNIDYNGKEVLTFSFEEIEAVAFRVTGNCARNEKSENFRLMELEAYYYPDMPSELITGTATDENDLYNIPVPDPVLDNLAAGKKVTANETLIVEKFVYDPNFLTDGNSNYFAGTGFNAITRYNASSNCAWYEVDFGAVTKFNRITVFLSQWEVKYLPKDMAIDIRLANGTYKRVAEMHNINYTDVKQLMFSFEDVEAIAFRVTGKRTRNERSDNFRLMELGAYYYPNMPKEEITGIQKDTNAEYNIEIPDPMLKNLASGMQATANDELKSNDIIYSASRLTDGFSKYNCDSATAYTAITRWIDGKKTGWFEIAFKEATLLNQVKLCLSQWEKEFLPLDIAIDAKLENGNFVRVAEMHNIDYSGKQELVFYFPEQKAVSFRVVGNANRNEKSFNFRLVEIEAFYWPGLPTEKYTGTTKDANPLYNINNEDLIPAEKDKNNTNNTNKKPIISTGVPLDIGAMQNNTTNEESKFEMSSMEYLILFVVAAGFVLLAFMGGSSAVLIFVNRKLKPSNKTQSIN